MGACVGWTQYPGSGPSNGSRYALKKAIADRVREEIWPLYDKGLVKPVIHAVFPLHKAREAHELMESSAHIGKIMLEIGA